MTGLSSISRQKTAAITAKNSERAGCYFASSMLEKSRKCALQLDPLAVFRRHLSARTANAPDVIASASEAISTSPTHLGTGLLRRPRLLAMTRLENRGVRSDFQFEDQR